MDVVQKALLSCSESLVLGHGHGFHSGVSAAGPRDILMASLGHLLLKDVNDVGLFKSLRICSLPDNFITTIDALAECVLLVKLDLKGNQVSAFSTISHRPIVIVHLKYLEQLWWLIKTHTYFFPPRLSNYQMHCFGQSWDSCSFLISMTTTWRQYRTPRDWLAAQTSLGWPSTAPRSVWRGTTDAL